MKISDKKEFDKVNVFGQGKENTAYAKYFIGNSYLVTVPITLELLRHTAI